MDAIAFLGYYNILLLYILPLTKLCNSIIIIKKKKTNKQGKSSNAILEWVKF